MAYLKVDNYIINKPILDILYRLRLALTNGKLKDIKTPSGGATNIVVTCPHHSDGREATPACNIYIGEDGKLPYGYFNCFVCGERGSFLKFVAECFDSSEAYAKDWLVKTFEGELIEQQVFLSDEIQIEKPKTKINKLDPAVLDTYQTWSPYLGQRKLSREICELFKVRYDPKYRQIIFPYYNEKGQLITLLKRSIDTKTFFIEAGIAKPVYGINKIFQNNIHTCVLTEGLFDCLLANQYGMPAIATLGNPSLEQFELINKSPISTIYLMFDNDSAGRSFTEKAHKYLSKRLFIIDVNIIGKKDIGELSYDEFWKFINIAKETC